MRKLLSTAFSIFLLSSVAHAVPGYRVQAGLVVPVSGGCGIGVHRGPFNGCNVAFWGYRHAYYRGYANGNRDGYFDGSYGDGRGWLVDQGACSGLKPYLICAPDGSCWADCYGRVELGW